MNSSTGVHNFHCVTIASVDFLKLPLKDILASRIKPENLFKEINSCSTLLSGKDKLRPDQQKICFLQPPDIPDYSKFDVTLLYTLIRNLCPKPEPTQGWGKEPKPADKQISDDIERIRQFRNNYFAHARCAAFTDSDFKAIWENLRAAVERIQKNVNYTVDYNAELIKIESSKCEHDHFEQCQLLLRAYAGLDKDDRADPDFFIKGQDAVVCGEKAQFEVDVKTSELSCCLIKWQKRNGEITEDIDTSKMKYSGSSKSILVIQSVCKKDEGEYQVVFSRKSNENEYKLSTNKICLQVLGEVPELTDLEVIPGKQEINICCCHAVKELSPSVQHIEWSKNDRILDEKCKPLLAKHGYNCCLEIPSPSLEDRGKYSCTVSNPVGCVSKHVIIDVPSVNISIKSTVSFYGSKTTIKSVVLSNPSPGKVEWQRSKDGNTFDFIDIEQPKYFGSLNCFESPYLVISNTTFDDRLYYRLLVWNKIGKNVSNVVYLNVTGSTPNITTCQKTNIKSKTVTLIGTVFLYDDSPEVSEVFWTKNGIRIDTQKSGGRLSEVTINDPSLTIKNVCRDDTGNYQLTATNAVGSTISDSIILAGRRLPLEIF